MSYQAVILVQLGSTDTGLTLSAKLFDVSNVQQGATVTTGFTELGNGEYEWVGTIPSGFEGTARFYSGGATYQTSLPINGTLEKLIAIQAKTALIGTAGVEFSNPLVTSDSLTLRRGDDYSANLGNAPSWTKDSWPDLSSADVEFAVKHRFTGISIEPIECEVSGSTVTVPIPSTVTASLSPGVDLYLFDVQATIEGERLTLVTGELTVTEDVVDAT